MMTPGYYPITGGTEAMVRELSSRLNNTGISTDIMTFNMDKKWKPKWHSEIGFEGKSKVFKIAGLNWFPPSTARINQNVFLLPTKYTNLLKNYDLIHYHEAEFSFPLSSHFVNKPKILHLHGISHEYFKRYPLSRKIMCNSADLFLSITKQIKKELVDLGIPDEKILYFPNSVDTCQFYPKGEKAKNVILYVGRLTPDKGLHVLLKSLKLLRNSVELIIIGPEDWNHNYHNMLMSLINSENARGKHAIKYLGRVSKECLISCYQKASIFVLPSFDEAFGIVILEALACETPVVATRAGGAPEALSEGENGLLVPPNNAEKLSEALDLLLDNDKLREDFGKNGRSWVENNFSFEILLKRLTNIYQQLAT